MGQVGEKLPYKSNKFDLVFLFHVLEHVDNEKKTIDEIYRVLKKGGQLVVSSPYKGMFSWADSANLRYWAPWLHKIVASIFYGRSQYNQLFIKNRERDLYGNSSMNRHWHKHYTETEIRQMLVKHFKINLLLKYSLFM